MQDFIFIICGLMIAVPPLILWVLVCSKAIIDLYGELKDRFKRS